MTATCAPAIKDFTVFHLCCGLGGGKKGFNKARARLGNLAARFRCIGGIALSVAQTGP